MTMRKNYMLVAVFLLAAFSMVACANRAQTGAAVGGASGALIGSTFGNWGVGAGIGAALGYIVGNEWDKRDEAMARQSIQENRRTRWTNQDTGRTYTSVPGDTYTRNGRTYKTVTIIDDSGRERQATMVMNNDGRWEMAN